MKAVDLLIHSVRQVFGNLGAVLRVTGLLYAVQIAAMILLSPGLVYGRAVQAGEAMTGGFILLSFLSVVLSIVIGLWMAVAFHRYILKSELAGAPLPPFLSDRIVAYFGYSLLVGLAVLPLVLILMLVAMPLLMGMSGGSMEDPRVLMDPSFAFKVTLVMTLLYVPVGAVLFRVSSVLPAAAIGERLAIGQAWEKTAGTTTTMAALALLVGAAVFVLDLPLLLGLLPGYLPALIWSVVTGWIKWSVGISLLTTIYGHYIEGRPLITQAG